MGLKKVCENIMLSMFSHGVDSALMIGGAGLVIYGGIKLYQLATEIERTETDDTDVKYAKPKAMKIEISDNSETENGDDVEIDISGEDVSDYVVVTEIVKKRDWVKRIRKYVGKMMKGVIMIQASNLITLNFTKVLCDRFNAQSNVLAKITTMLTRLRGKSSWLKTLSTVADERSRGVLIGESKGIDSVVSSVASVITKG